MPYDLTNPPEFAELKGSLAKPMPVMTIKPVLELFDLQRQSFDFVTIESN